MTIGLRQLYIRFEKEKDLSLKRLDKSVISVELR